MSVLNKPYELSVWFDEWDSEQECFVETRVCTIGAHNMISQSRALNPKLVSNVNGSNTFSFTIYYRYKDNITGEVVDNPFVQYLANERKLKLEYNGKWYDLIIKNIKIDSTKYTYDITATDQYINELSKNGFNKTFDAELRNNIGTIQGLAQNTLQETDWQVPSVTNSNSEFIADRAKENLVEIIVTENFNAIQIQDEDEGEEPDITTTVPFSVGQTIYGFYSCCKQQTSRFSFIYVSNIAAITTDDERIITNKNSQYYIDDVSYSGTPNYGVNCPSFGSIQGISTSYRGARYVFSPDMKYSPVIGQYVTSYWKNSFEYYGYTTTEYKAPNLIQNLITNPTNFKSTDGWRAVYLASGGSKGDLKNEALRRDNDTDIRFMDDLKDGNFNPEQPWAYHSVLTYTSNEPNQALINSGFFDNRKIIKNLVPEKKYIIQFKANTTPSTISCGLYYQPQTADINYWALKNNLEYWSIDSFEIADDSTSYKTYYAEVTVNNKAAFTPKEYQNEQGASNGKVLIVITSDQNIELQIEDFQIFEYIPYILSTGESHVPYVVPEDQLMQAQIITTYHLYNKNIDNDLTKTVDDYQPVYEGTHTFEEEGYFPILSCEKRRAITIKESNYFNIIQTLCETFECWADFQIEHDSIGNILSKTLVFKNQIGEENYAGFRYGVNLKSISRTDDSKSIVTKLIVRQNANEFGEHGFCTITRAPSNPSGENYIYNFDHYIKQGLLKAEDWINTWYDTTETLGYEHRFNIFNTELVDIANSLANQAVPLAQAQADVTLYKNGLDSAIENLEAASDSFSKMFWGYEWTNFQTVSPNDENYINPQYLEKNIKYLTACCEYYQASKDYAAKYSTALSYQQTLQASYNALEARQKQLLYGYTDEEQVYHPGKNDLIIEFYSKFSRYIQEGTWNSEDYYDDEQYYLDAESTLYNSCTPKVTYSMSVLELSQLLNYEAFTFALGDRTYVEDTEFFGYDESGAPVREEVVLTEITYNLDQPEKNSIKMQTYKTQFQDLFKKITATVQSVSYSTGEYNKAAELATATNKQKSVYLQGALTDAGTILTNLAEQTVRIDATGLTITDGLAVNKALRAVSGGILLTEDGGNTWKMAITANGVSAEVLTSGILNTGEVNIMYGAEPTFRWDAFGLTAYDYTVFNGNISQINPYKGVRFDRLGLYGFNGADGDWHPTAIVDWEITNNQYAVKQDGAGQIYIRNHSTFELTKEGLYLSLGEVIQKHFNTIDNQGVITYTSFNTAVQHQSQVALGRVNDLIFNKWDDTYHRPWYNINLPDADTFIQVMSVGSSNNPFDAPFILYDDGTLMASKAFIEGSITATSGSIGGWSITTDRLSSTNVGLVSDGATINNIANTVIYAGTTFNVTNTGHLYAKAGSIGGWIIENNLLYGSYTDYDISGYPLRYVGMAKPGIYNYPVFFAGATSSDVSVSDWSATFSVKANGAMTSTKGEIAGWVIGPDALAKGSGSSCVTLSSSGSYRIWAGSNTASSAPFSIQADGTLKASKGNIAGWTLNATSLTKNGIGTNDSIHLYTADLDNQASVAGYLTNTWRLTIGSNFGVDSSGTVYCQNIKTTNPGAVWNIQKIQPAKGTSDNYTVTISNGQIVQTSSTTFGVRFKVSNLSWSIRSTNDLTLAVKTQSTNQYLSITIPTGTEFTNNGLIIIHTPSQNVSPDEAVWFDVGGTVYSDTIATTISGLDVIICKASFYPDSTNTFDLGSSQSRWANIWQSSGSITGSDRRIKTNINTLSAEYNNFFDELSPVTYRLINGQSGRTHAGFIAQDVESALLSSNLTAQDFAGFCHDNTGGPDGDMYSLRYDEFITLNTWQIQLLKPRVSSLEQRCLDLEARVAELEAQLNENQ